VDLDLKLLQEVREQRDAARKIARQARLAAEEAENEYHGLDATVHNLERIVREHNAFNTSASDLLN
jgi:hypothetical protein